MNNEKTCYILVNQANDNPLIMIENYNIRLHHRLQKKRKSTGVVLTHGERCSCYSNPRGESQFQ